MAGACSRNAHRALLLGGLVLAPIAAGAIAAPPRGGTPEKEQARLERVRREIEQLRDRLEKTEAREGSVLDGLEDLDLRSALLSRELETLRRDIAALENRRAATARQAESLQAGLSLREAEMRRWLREAYKAGPLRYARLLAAASSPAQMATAHRALQTLALSENRRLDAFRAERSLFDDLLASLSVQRQDLERMETDVWNKSQEVRDNRRRKEAVLSALKRERATQKKALLELVQVETEIRGLLDRLSRAGAGGAGTLGFARFRGRLDWPVSGKVVVPFGNVRHPRFSTEIPHPGIDIAAPAGRNVQAVYDGRVVFSDWFRGYGQMIVLDHGDGYLSIYGHVDERLVVAGREVVQGDPIARCGLGGTFDTPGLYFEIRHDGRPEDPSSWLRQTAGGAATGTSTTRRGVRRPDPTPRGERP
ncbi:MAG: murein hydrolase activator EnvC family protein [Candidatus Polarisedimenticolia bacterium]